MDAFKNAFAILVALAPAGLPAAAAPMSIDGAAMVGMRESIPAAEHDVQRQGYVTALRSASLGNALQGRVRARGQATLGFASLLNSQHSAGWTIHTAVATADIFSPLVGGLLLSARGDVPPGAASRLSSSFNVGELGRLDDGTRAVQRVIEGARVFSDADDPTAMLFTAR
jgi:hypothetical protein